MDFVPFRLFRKRSSELRKRLEEQGQLVLMLDDEPLALMLNIPGGSPEDFVLLVSRIRAKLAVAKIREEARKSGRKRISMREVNALVNQARARRQAKRSA